MRGASRTLRCVCVLQLVIVISGDTVEIDLKAPRHSSRLPLGTEPCTGTHACSTHYCLVIHKALCLVTRTRHARAHCGPPPDVPRGASQPVMAPTLRESAGSEHGPAASLPNDPRDAASDRREAARKRQAAPL